MMNKVFTAGAALLAVVSASPTTPARASLFKLPQSVDFEDVSGIPVVAAASVGITHGIYWQGFGLAITGLQDLITVEADSGKNVAVFDMDGVATLTGGPPAMTANYANSSTNNFNLSSFYYGCVLASEARVVSVPQSCTITIRGYSDDEATQKVAEQSFDFKVALLQTNAQMSKAEVSSDFKGLKRVNFFVSNELVLAGLIDTVDYTVYSESRSLA
jgi:hypothetical protein